MGKVENAVELLGAQSGLTASYFNHNGDDQSISVRSLLKRANAQNVSFSISVFLQCRNSTLTFIHSARATTDEYAGHVFFASVSIIIIIIIFLFTLGSLNL